MSWARAGLLRAALWAALGGALGGALAGCADPGAPLTGEEAAALSALLEEAVGSARQEELQRAESRMAARGWGEGLALARLELEAFAPSAERVAAAAAWAEAHPGEGRLVRASLALREGEVAAARRHLGPEPPQGDLERLIYARLAWAGGEPGAGIAWIDGMARVSRAARLLRVRLLAEAGRGEEAGAELRELLREDVDLLAAQVLRVELAPPEVRGSLADLVQVRYRLPEGLRARVVGAQAQAMLLTGDPERASSLAEAALRLDGAVAPAALVIADREARAGRLRRALEALGGWGWSGGGAGAAEVEVAAALILLDLDRVEEAEARVEALERRQALSGLTPALRLLIAVAGRGEAPKGPIPAGDRAAFTWARALMAILALDPEAVALTSAALDRAREAQNPFERRLAARAQAARAGLAGPEGGRADLRDAISRWPEEPSLHLAVAQVYEAARARARAASHYRRAVELCPDCGRAWYEYGRFYQDSPDDRTKDAWARYLSLDPSGPRADRVRRMAEGGSGDPAGAP